MYVDKLRENQLNSPMATSHVQSSSVNADQEKLLERLKTTVDEANKKIRKVEDEIKQVLWLVRCRSWLSNCIV